MPQQDPLAPFRDLPVREVGPDGTWRLAPPAEGVVTLDVASGRDIGVTGRTLRLEHHAERALDDDRLLAGADLLDGGTIRRAGLLFHDPCRASGVIHVHRASDLLLLGEIVADPRCTRPALRVQRFEAGLLARPGDRASGMRAKRFTLEDVRDIPAWVRGGGLQDDDRELATIIAPSGIRAGKMRVGRVLHRTAGHVLVADLAGGLIELRAENALPGRPAADHGVRIVLEATPGRRSWCCHIPGRAPGGIGPLAAGLPFAATLLMEHPALSGHEKLPLAAYLDAEAASIAARVETIRRQCRTGGPIPDA